MLDSEFHLRLGSLHSWPDEQQPVLRWESVELPGLLYPEHDLLMLLEPASKNSLVSQADSRWEVCRQQIPELVQVSPISPRLLQKMRSAVLASAILAPHSPLFELPS